MAPSDFLDMFEGWKKERELGLKDTSAFVAMILNVHLDKKHAVSPNRIYSVFEPPKSREEILEERARFLEDFKKQRKEAEAHGNSS